MKRNRKSQPNFRPGEFFDKLTQKLETSGGVCNVRNRNGLFGNGRLLALCGTLRSRERAYAPHENLRFTDNQHGSPMGAREGGASGDVVCQWTI